MSLKDIIASDLDIFINSDDFAEPHNVDGSVILCVLETDTYMQQSNTIDTGVSEVDAVLFVKTDELAEKKEYGEHINIDDDTYTVVKYEDNMGMTRMELQKGVI